MRSAASISYVKETSQAPASFMTRLCPGAIPQAAAVPPTRSTSVRGERQRETHPPDLPDADQDCRGQQSGDQHLLATKRASDAYADASMASAISGVGSGAAAFAGSLASMRREAAPRLRRRASSSAASPERGVGVVKALREIDQRECGQRAAEHRQRYRRGLRERPLQQAGMDAIIAKPAPASSADRELRERICVAIGGAPFGHRKRDDEGDT